jgi:hypothetical protein
VAPEEQALACYIWLTVVPAKACSGGILLEEGHILHRDVVRKVEMNDRIAADGLDVEIAEGTDPDRRERPQVDLVLAVLEVIEGVVPVGGREDRGMPVWSWSEATGTLPSCSGAHPS